MKSVSQSVQPFMIAAFGLMVAVAGAANTAHGGEDVRPERKAFHKAMKACAEENGIVMKKGERPTEENRAKIDACLESKGIAKPPRPPHPPHGKHHSHAPPPPPPPDAPEEAPTD